MEEYKKKVAEMIVKSLDSETSVEDILIKIEEPKDKKNGDLAYPCFNLAKTLKKSPVIIAEELEKKIKLNDLISSVKAVNGYLNFYINSKNIVGDVLQNILNKPNENLIKNVGNNENIIIEYSSPNIAKPFHLGHFRNTVLGNSLYRIYKELGYNVTGINHLGDWGRQFGLIIEGYKRYSKDYDMENEPLKSISDIYVKMTKLSKEDESIIEIARQNFKKLEQGDKEAVEIWKFIREISLKEYMKVYDLLHAKFDSYNGEAFYSDKLR